MSLWKSVYPSRPQLTLPGPPSLAPNLRSASRSRVSAHSYKSLSPKTRAIFGVGVMVWASIGLWTSSQVEQAMGMVPTEEEKAELERKLAIRVSRVGKD
ncbi:hypothetical protein BDW66DRAFT_151530 [Aspergillus desertorum]